MREGSNLSTHWRPRVWWVHQRSRSSKCSRRQDVLHSRHTMTNTSFRLFVRAPHNSWRWKRGTVFPHRWALSVCVSRHSWTEDHNGKCRACHPGGKTTSTVTVQLPVGPIHSTTHPLFKREHFIPVSYTHFFVTPHTGHTERIKP
jgi:hypothetical protein